MAKDHLFQPLFFHLEVQDTNSADNYSASFAHTLTISIRSLSNCRILKTLNKILNYRLNKLLRVAAFENIQRESRRTVFQPTALQSHLGEKSQTHE